MLRHGRLSRIVYSNDNFLLWTYPMAFHLELHGADSKNSEILANVTESIRNLPLKLSSPVKVIETWSVSICDGMG